MLALWRRRERAEFGADVATRSCGLRFAYRLGDVAGVETPDRPDGMAAAVEVGDAGPESAMLLSPQRKRV